MSQRPSVNQATPTPSKHTAFDATAKVQESAKHSTFDPASPVPVAGNGTNIMMNSSNNRKSKIPDPESMTHAKESYNELQTLLGALSDKLTGVSNQVDKEFLSSYRVHMLSIQSEVRHLKQEVNMSEQRLNDDVQVARLESETKWFIEECSRLRNHYDAMKSDCEQMSHRLHGMVEQKDYLGAQLKALVKRNRVLLDVIDEMKGINVSFDAKLARKKSVVSLARQASTASIASHTSQASQASHDSHQSKASHRSRASHTSQEMPPLQPQRTLPKLKKGLSQSTGALGMKRAASSLRSLPPLEVDAFYQDQLDTLNTGRHDLELELEESIQTVFKEIGSRRLTSLHKASTRLPTLIDSPRRPKSPGYVDSDPLLNAHDDHHVVLPMLVKQAGGISGLGTEQFSDHDKFAAMVNFLSKPAIMEEVLRLLQEGEGEGELEG